MRKHTQTFLGFYKDGGINEQANLLAKFYSNWMGISAVWNGKEPEILEMTKDFAYYRENIRALDNDLRPTVIANQTGGYLDGTVDLYFSDPNMEEADLYPSPGAWGGLADGGGWSIIPAVSIRKDQITRSTRKWKHEMGHWFFGRDHDPNNRSVMYDSYEEGVKEEDIILTDFLIKKVCPSTVQDPVITPQMRFRQYLAAIWGPK
jgi:hypothetical protein